MTTRTAILSRLIAICFGMIAIILTGCRSTAPMKSTAYSAIKIHEIEDKPPAHVIVEGYVLGQEYREERDDKFVWIVVISETPAPNMARAREIVWPDVDVKLRGVEEGFNRHILLRAQSLCTDAMRQGQPVRLYGQPMAGKSFRQYKTGMHLRITQVEANGVKINVDFDDRSVVEEKGPGIIKKLYHRGKKLFDLVGKLT